MLARLARSHAPRRARRGLMRKYVVLFGGLVCALFLATGLVDLYFSLDEQRSTVYRAERQQAVAAGERIKTYLTDINQQIEWAVPPQGVTGSTAFELREAGYERLRKQVVGVVDVRHIDAEGKEQLYISKIRMKMVGSGADFSNDPRFTAPTKASYFGPIYSPNGSEPYMSIAYREPGEAGVTAVEVNLKLIWDVISRLKFETSGYVYVVDGNGRLVAHPDISMVLRQLNLSDMPQVQYALTHPTDQEFDPIARNLAGRAVVTAYERIEPSGWYVFVDQPLEEAFAPVIISLGRTFLLFVAGILLAVILSLFLARRMVAPIQDLQRGAQQIGAGALDQRIEVHTGDELQALAEEFNAMAERVRESYATLEQKVEERTQTLAETLQELEEKSHQLEIASRHKSEFLANMSHELRTPLNAVIGFSEVLSQRMYGPVNEKQEEYLQDIVASGRHLLSLINDLLDLAKIEQGRMDLELRVFSIRNVLQTGLTMVRQVALQHGVTLSVEVADGVDEVEADERKVKQIVFNLLSNAVKFTPDGGTVTVSARAENEEIVVAVRDTGIGIAPEDQDRIFDEFQQVHRRAVTRQRGTGLGLAVARNLVELHHGRIWVESALGAGSTFTFTLPLRRAGGPIPDGVEVLPQEAVERNAVASTVGNGHSAPVEAIPATPAQPSEAISRAPWDAKRGATVVVVEDDTRAIEIMQAVLRPEGYRVMTATDGLRGLEVIERERPALVILDLAMPEMDGFTVVERLRTNPATATIPIIIMTARTVTEEDRVRLDGHISHLAHKGDFTWAGFVNLVRTYAAPPAA
jgi:signal transduction histidine kinase/CheY-like chemotaxis protein